MPKVPTVRQLVRSAALGAVLLGAPVLAGCESTPTLANAPDNLAVDQFLWQGALDTLAILPIAVADPATGRIETGWGRLNNGKPNEEFRAIVQIYPGPLSANSVAVEVYRRLNGTPAGVRPGVPSEVQEAILLRARQIRASIDL